MFDDELHKKALVEFLAYLRTCSSQRDIAFFSDHSREYIRKVGKGETIPSIKKFFDIIIAANVDLKEGLNLYVKMLEDQKAIQDNVELIDHSENK